MAATKKHCFFCVFCIELSLHLPPFKSPGFTNDYKISISVKNTGSRRSNLNFAQYFVVY